MALSDSVSVGEAKRHHFPCFAVVSRSACPDSVDGHFQGMARLPVFWRSLRSGSWLWLTWLVRLRRLLACLARRLSVGSWLADASRFPLPGSFLRSCRTLSKWLTAGNGSTWLC